MPPAFIKFGGFSVKKTFRDNFLPEQDRPFKITVIDCGEVDAKMSYGRIKIPANQFREIMLKLRLKEDARLQMKSLPHGRYEISKQS